MNQDIQIQTFILPDNFEIDEHIDRWWGIFSKDKMNKVKVEFSNGAAQRIRKRVWPEGYKLITKSGDKLILEFKTNQLESVLYWLLSWREDAKVIGPPLLKEMIIQNINGMLRKYE